MLGGRDSSGPVVPMTCKALRKEPERAVYEKRIIEDRDTAADLSGGGIRLFYMDAESEPYRE